MPVTLKPKAHHTFNGPQGDFVSVTNESSDSAAFDFTYKKDPKQSHKLGGYASQNYPPTTFPVTVTNTGTTTISVGVDL